MRDETGLTRRIRSDLGRESWTGGIQRGTGGQQPTLCLCTRVLPIQPWHVLLETHSFYSVLKQAWLLAALFFFFLNLIEALLVQSPPLLRLHLFLRSPSTLSLSLSCLSFLSLSFLSLSLLYPRPFCHSAARRCAVQRPVAASKAWHSRVCSFLSLQHQSCQPGCFESS